MFTQGAYLLAGYNVQPEGWYTMGVLGRDARSLELNLKKANP